MPSKADIIASWLELSPLVPPVAEGDIAVIDFMQHTGVTKDVARRKLSALVDDGLAVTHLARRADGVKVRVYRLVEEQE